LPTQAGIIPASAITHADIQITIGSEMDVASVVIREILRNHHDLAAAVEVDDIRIASRHLELGNHCIASRNAVARFSVGVVDVDATIAGVLRMKGQTEQPAFASRGCQRRDVEKGRGEHVIRGIDDSDKTIELDDKSSPAAIVSVSNGHRAIEGGTAEGGFEGDVGGDLRQRQRTRQQGRKDQGNSSGHGGLGLVGFVPLPQGDLW